MSVLFGVDCNGAAWESFNYNTASDAGGRPFNPPRRAPGGGPPLPALPRAEVAQQTVSRGAAGAAGTEQGRAESSAAVTERNPVLGLDGAWRAPPRGGGSALSLRAAHPRSPHSCRTLSPFAAPPPQLASFNSQVRAGKHDRCAGGAAARPPPALRPSGRAASAASGRLRRPNCLLTQPAPPPRALTPSVNSLKGATLIHYSPPCQQLSSANSAQRRRIGPEFA